MTLLNSKVIPFIRRYARVETTSGARYSALISGVSTDSRTMTGDELFIAIDGDRYKGVDYIGQVVEKGCRQIVINEKDCEQIDYIDNTTYYIVPDTRVLYQKIAEIYIKQFTGCKIAITGSAGKTSLKEYLFHFLNRKYKVFKTYKNENNQIGVPQNIFQIKEDYDFFLFELGTNNVGEMSSLSKIIRPDITVITNVLPAHIGNFEDRKAIAKEKATITNYQKPGGTLLIDQKIAHKNRILSQVSSQIKVIEWNEHSSFEIEFDNPIRTMGRDENFGVEAEFEGINLYGCRNLAILKTIQETILPKEKDLFYNLRLDKVPRRCEIVLEGDSQPLLIDDAYNANPTSMWDSVEMIFNQMNLQSNTNSRYRKLFFVLGDIFELGKESIYYHLSLLKKMVKIIDDLGGNRAFSCEILLLGNFFSESFKEFLNPPSWMSHYREDKLMAHLLEEVDKHSIVFFKASNGMNFHRIIDDFRNQISGNNSTN